jgi:hypothetical protein
MPGGAPSIIRKLKSVGEIFSLGMHPSKSASRPEMSKQNKSHVGRNVPSNLSALSRRSRPLRNN